MRLGNKDNAVPELVYTSAKTLSSVGNIQPLLSRPIFRLESSLMRHSHLFPTLVLVLLLCSACQTTPDNLRPTTLQATRVDTVDLASFFESVEGPGSFLLYNAETGHKQIYNPERAHERFLPASTFKIPNSLIALELGVVTDASYAIARDTVLSPMQDFWSSVWKQPRHTLESAFQNSIYWYYQEVARRIGEARMQRYVDHFNYGNRNISGDIDGFWLYGDLRVSPEEQLGFLARFYNGELGLSERTTQIVKDIMVMEDTTSYRLGGKTGTGELTPTRELGWLIGYVELEDVTYFYVLNMEGERVWEEWPPQKRIGLVKDILRHLDVLPSTVDN